MERRSLGLQALLEALPDQDLEISLPAVGVSEMLVGIYRTPLGPRRQRMEAFLDALLEAVPVTPFDLRVARTYGRLWAELATSGQLIGVHDAQIAATALTHGYGVLTTNGSHFQRVPGLSVAVPRWP